MQTTIMFKTDKKLKEAAQKKAKRLGVPFSSILNDSMRKFVNAKGYTFSDEPLIPTPYLKRILDKTDKELKDVKNLKTFKSVKELMADLEN
jgi:antitoxin component of RelBE/YafQ-DinJ toxin-antitoxin module